MQTATAKKQKPHLIPISAPAATVPIPVPTVEANAALSNEAYHADRSAVSNSMLKQILRSPAHLQAYLKEPHKETPAMAIGTALHCSILEPDRFNYDYLVWIGGDKRGKVWDAFQEEVPGKKIMKPDEMKLVMGMRNAVLSYSEFPLAAAIDRGQSEFSIKWTDPETGLRCKSRFDSVSDYAILDLKKTQDARPEKFIRSCVELNYDLQAAMYTEGCKQALGKSVPFYFIAVEEDAPHGVWVHEAGASLLESGMEKYRRALALYKRCLDTGEWPGYALPYSVLEWPKWAKR